MLPSLPARDIRNGVKQLLVTAFEPSDNFFHGPSVPAVLAQRPVRASDNTQPSIRDFICAICFLSKKSSGFTRSIGYTGR